MLLYRQYIMFCEILYINEQSYFVISSYQINDLLQINVCWQSLKCQQTLSMVGTSHKQSFKKTANKIEL